MLICRRAHVERAKAWAVRTLISKIMSLTQAEGRRTDAHHVLDSAAYDRREHSAIIIEGDYIATHH